MISKKEVEHMATLARLKLTDQEVKKYQKQLAKILDYVDQLKKVKTEKVKPCTGGTNLENIFRQDKPRQSSPKMRQALLKNAPLKRGDLIKTREVFTH